MIQSCDDQALAFGIQFGEQVRSIPLSPSNPSLTHFVSFSTVLLLEFLFLSLPQSVKQPPLDPPTRPPHPPLLLKLTRTLLSHALFEIIR